MPRAEMTRRFFTADDCLVKPGNRLVLLVKSLETLLAFSKGVGEVAQLEFKCVR